MNPAALHHDVRGVQVAVVLPYFVNLFQTGGQRVQEMQAFENRDALLVLALDELFQLFPLEQLGDEELHHVATKTNLSPLIS